VLTAKGHQHIRLRVGFTFFGQVWFNRAAIAINGLHLRLVVEPGLELMIKGLEEILAAGFVAEPDEAEPQFLTERRLSSFRGSRRRFEFNPRDQGRGSRARGARRLQLSKQLLNLILQFVYLLSQITLQKQRSPTRTVIAPARPRPRLTTRRIRTISQWTMRQRIP